MHPRNQNQLFADGRVRLLSDPGLLAEAAENLYGSSWLRRNCSKFELALIQYHNADYVLATTHCTRILLKSPISEEVLVCLTT